MTQDLGRLLPVSVRDVWKHEARDFTRWLLANADVLADVLGMDLELTAAEHPVGAFSLDLIGKDLATNEVVIVENQLEATDHGHLGQLLTYAGGTNPATIVWCAPRFRDDHRAALDWLNEHTDEGTRFFGVEVSAVQIDDSRPAPLFRLVAQPNDWAKQVHADSAGSLSEKGAAYSAFWSALLDRIRDEHPDWTRSRKGGRDSWITLPYGTSSIWYGMVFASTGPRVELYFGSPDAETNQASFDDFRAHSHVLDEAFGPGLQFDPLPGKKACRIHYDRPYGGDVLDQGNDYEQWFIDTFARFRSATQQVRKLLETAA